MKKNGLRVNSSNPELTKKLYTNIEENSDVIYWYIKFNIPLDPDSVNSKTTYVTDVGGYVMNTFIEYSPNNNLISISPIDTYEQNIYYILNITTKVKSLKGNKLPRKVYILFKLENDKISEYEVLKKEVIPPQPRNRPSNYNIHNVRSKVYGVNKDLNHNLDRDKLPKLAIKFNFIIPIINLIILCASIFSKNIVFITIAIIIGIIGLIYIFYQLSKSENASKIYYNLGKYNFEKENYEKAVKYIEKAYDKDNESEEIEFAYNRIQFYK